METLIAYRCRAADHQIGSSPHAQPGSPITYHDGNWAYCPSGLADGHSWQRVTPMSLDQLKRQPIEKARA